MNYDFLNPPRRLKRLLKVQVSSCQHHAHLPSPPHRPTMSTFRGSECLLQPEFEESVLVGVEHLPHIEAAGVSFGPLVQLLVVGIVG